MLWVCLHLNVACRSARRSRIHTHGHGIRDKHHRAYTPIKVSALTRFVLLQPHAHTRACRASHTPAPASTQPMQSHVRISANESLFQYIHKPQAYAHINQNQPQLYIGALKEEVKKRTSLSMVYLLGIIIVIIILNCP